MISHIKRCFVECKTACETEEKGFSVLLFSPHSSLTVNGLHLVTNEPPTKGSANIKQQYPQRCILSLTLGRATSSH